MSRDGNPEDYKIITLNGLYDSKTGCHSFKRCGGEIFTDINKRGKPFIKVTYPPDKIQAFSFTVEGFEKAMNWLLRHGAFSLD